MLVSQEKKSILYFYNDILNYHTHTREDTMAGPSCSLINLLLIPSYWGCWPPVQFWSKIDLLACSSGTTYLLTIVYSITYLLTIVYSICCLFACWQIDILWKKLTSGGSINRKWLKEPDLMKPTLKRLSLTKLALMRPGLIASAFYVNDTL